MKSLGSEDMYEPESTLPTSDFLIPMDAVQQLFKGTGGKLNILWFPKLKYVSLFDLCLYIRQSK